MCPAEGKHHVFALDAVSTVLTIITVIRCEDMF